jgi:cell division transport system permease protein
VSRISADLRYFARTSLSGLRTSTVTSVVSATTIGVALVLVGAFTLLLRNMEGLLDTFGDDLRVTAYLDDALEPGAHPALADRVSTIEGVSEVVVVSKEEALRRFQEGVGRTTGLLAALEENPLPASLEISLSDARRTPEGLRVVVEALDGLPGVADLAYGQEWVEGYARVVGLVRGVALGVGGVLALATLLIVANTIRLSVYARRDELQILSLVGASRPFIATPFLAEGALQGALGGMLAVAVLYAMFRLALPEIEAGLTLLLGFAEPRFLDLRSVLRLIGAGGLLGLLGSAAAVLQGLRE